MEGRGRSSTLSLGKLVGAPVFPSTLGLLCWEPVPDGEAVRMDESHHLLWIPLGSRVNVLHPTSPFPPRQSWKIFLLTEPRA